MGTLGRGRDRSLPLSWKVIVNYVYTDEVRCIATRHHISSVALHENARHV